MQGKMKEKGIIPSIADLEACQRVGEHELDLFNELAGELAGELSRRLQDNRALKAELEAFKGVNEKLDGANAEVVKQKKALDRLPQAEKERDEAREQASEAESREKQLKTRLEELTTAHSEQSKRFSKASVNGFQMALNLTVILAPRVNFAYFNGKHIAREGKIYLGEKVVYDSADHPSDAKEEEDVDSPTSVVGADQGAA